MVRNHINHEVHPPPMQRIGQSDQISLSAEMAIQRIDILSPIPMVRSSIRTVPLDVLHDGRYPDLHFSLSMAIHQTKHSTSLRLKLTAVNPIFWI